MQKNNFFSFPITIIISKRIHKAHVTIFKWMQRKIITLNANKNHTNWITAMLKIISFILDMIIIVSAYYADGHSTFSDVIEKSCFLRFFLAYLKIENIKIKLIETIFIEFSCRMSNYLKMFLSKTIATKISSNAMKSVE